MSIEKHPDGRRSVTVEVEVPGTPEQVWQAIATGPGISSWFVPSTVEPKVGGETTNDFGGGMLATAKITAFDPPVRFVAEAPGWGEGMPPVATEWTVEAKSGGTCLVRVVHSMFASTDDWDGQLEGTEHGWPGFFRVLRRYLTQFVGQQSGQVLATAMTSSSLEDAWSRLSSALKVEGAAAGQRVSAQVAPGVTIAGTVDAVGVSGGHHTMHLELEQPANGTLYAGAFPCGGAMVSLQAYLYGDDAEAKVREVAPVVQKWLNGLFPAPEQPAS